MAGELVMAPAAVARRGVRPAGPCLSGDQADAWHLCNAFRALLDPQHQFWDRSCFLKGTARPWSLAIWSAVKGSGRSLTFVVWASLSYSKQTSPVY